MYKKESFVKVPGGRVYSRLYDPGTRFLGLRVSRMREALVMIHGGPGYPHDYLQGLSSLSDIIPVLFYDQLGCGRSDRVSDISLWKIDRFVEELEALRRFYGLEKLILHGHSWGTIVALEYTLRYPDIVTGLVFESPCISIPLWLKDSSVLLSKLDEYTAHDLNFRFR
jgi:proline iminopeptidase